MASKALFVGIGRHQSPHINDLAGAKRDAVALWSLFKDNMPALEDTLLVDEEATAKTIRTSLSGVLQGASSEDTVFISFAGHGSGDHRLVAFDTDAGDGFEGTSISMGELADLFSSSPAKAIVCVLDCCFSGGAPARVFPGRPAARAYKDPYTMVAGSGRVLVAACAVNESAYEDPRTSHGILTQALLGALQSMEEPTEVLAIAAAVSQRVRADAARYGIKQTPEVFGKVEGGLTLAPLARGLLCHQYFPDLSDATVNSTVASLAAFGFPAAVLSAWEDRFGGAPINDLQLQAVNDKRVLNGSSLLVVAPTSSGKTFVGELAALKAILEGRKAVFLLPYKALTNEKFDEFSALYEDELSLRVIRVTGDRTDAVPQFIKGKYDLALLTFEMFLNLVVGNPHMLRTIGLVVLDEAQFITDPSRGISVELLLTYLRAAEKRGGCPQIVALSAVIGGVNHFDEWLGAEALVTNERPVPLLEGVLDRHGTFQYLDADGVAQSEQLLPAGAIVQRKSKPGSQDTIVPLVEKLLEDDPAEKVLIFRNQRGSAQGCANYLARDLGLPPAEEALTLLPDADLSDASHGLRSALQGGTAFHTTNLTRDEKQVVERTYRQADSPVRVLAATTGVAAGVNTPASTVVVAEQEFLGEDGRPFTVAEYKNMAGRAGRKGFNEHGKSIILANTPAEREHLFSSYVAGDLEHLESSFRGEDLATWILKLLAQAAQVPREHVASLLAATYGGFLRVRHNPDWLATMHDRVEDLIQRMVGLDLVEALGDDVQLTLLGRACGNSSFSFESAMRLVELLQQQEVSDLTPVRLTALLQVLPEADDIYTPMFKRGMRESARTHDVERRFGAGTAKPLQRWSGDTFTWLGRCKRAAVLWDWINGVDVAEIESYYSISPYQGAIRYGHILGFANTTRFHLRSAAEILQVLVLDSEFDSERLDQLLVQLEVGLPWKALSLLELNVPLGRGQLLELYKLGVHAPEDLADFDPAKVLKAVGEESASALLATYVM